MGHGRRSIMYNPSQLEGILLFTFALPVPFSCSTRQSHEFITLYITFISFFYRYQRWVAVGTINVKCRGALTSEVSFSANVAVR